MEEKRRKTSENNWKIDESCWKNNEKAKEGGGGMKSYEEPSQLHIGNL